mgnify:CR=1 FL=1
MIADRLRMQRKKRLILYDYGAGENNWTTGAISGLFTKTYSKEIDHLFLKLKAGLGTPGYSVVTYVTTSTYDLSNYNTVNCLVNIDSNTSMISRYYFALIASTDQNGNSKIYDARITTNTKGDNNLSLDVSSLSGLYYVRIHAVYDHTLGPYYKDYFAAKTYHIKLA